MHITFSRQWHPHMSKHAKYAGKPFLQYPAGRNTFRHVKGKQHVPNVKRVWKMWEVWERTMFMSTCVLGQMFWNVQYVRRCLRRVNPALTIITDVQQKKNVGGGGGKFPTKEALFFTCEERGQWHKVSCVFWPLSKQRTTDWTYDKKHHNS